jgi:hypothetical protein
MGKSIAINPSFQIKSRGKMFNPPTIFPATHLPLMFLDIPGDCVMLGG